MSTRLRPRTPGDTPGPHLLGCLRATAPRVLRSRLLGRTFIAWLLVVLCLFTLLGCGAKRPDLRPEASYTVDSGNSMKSIAILPFSNRTDAEGINDFVRITFYSHLSAYPFRDIELHVVDQKLQQYEIADYEKFCKVPVQKLGRIIGSDVILIGEVTEFERIFAGVYSQIAVGISIEVWDTRTGQRIWTDEQIERHHEGGLPLTLTDIPFITIRSGMNLTETAKIQTVDEVTRYMASRIPYPDAEFSGGGSGGHSTASSKFKSLKKLTRKEKTAVEPSKQQSRRNTSPEAAHPVTAQTTVSH